MSLDSNPLFLVRYPGHRLATFAFWLAALLLVPAAQATVLCVATVNGGLDADDYGLVPAFNAANAGAEGSTWDIRVRQKTLQISNSLNFLPDGDKDNKQFYLSGGWNTNCSSQTGKASSTIIRGLVQTDNQPGTQILLLGDNFRYDVENIRFENFSNFSIVDNPCPPYNICPDTQSIYVEHVEFSNGGRVEIFTADAQRIVFRNNLVTKMHPIKPLSSTIDFAPVGFIVWNNEDAPQITFNTFADIQCSGTPGGVMIQSRQPKTALHHNIVQTTGCPHDLYIDTNYGGQPQALYYNLYLDAGGAVQGGSDNVTSFNPLFVDAFNGNYRLQNASPAVNKGATLLGAIQSGFILPGSDLDDNLRPVGTRYDIGAFESGVNDGAVPVITVNSDNDVDDGNCNAAHCSLREAINLANSQIGTSQRIVFNIPGGCPRTIILGSALPDITDPLVIDGTTQPGSATNDLELGSDATVCLVVGPGAAMTHALAVPQGQPDATRLTLSGMAFANGFYTFSTAAIELRAGSGHKISGSVFGGYMPPGNNPNQVGSLVRAIYLSGTANQFTIGGEAPADRNYFGSMSQNGIVMNSAGNSDGVITNNYIGVQPNGLGAQANAADGISASGGTGIAIYDNAICASDDGISLIGADTTKFTIQRNNIGVNAAGYGVAAHANHYGISIGLGSSQHVIGAAATENLQPGVYSNYIDNNDNAGIFISSNVSQSTTAGYNSIRGNLIEGNGRSGSGLGIQLGSSAAQLPNDAGDADSGANTLQNYPMLKGSAPAGATSRTVRAVLSTAPNQAVRVDFYHAAACGGAKGANATTLVGSTDVNSGTSGVVAIAATIAEAGASGYLTAIATTNVGQSSELAPCLREDTIFVDGLQAPGL